MSVPQKVLHVNEALLLDTKGRQEGVNLVNQIRWLSDQTNRALTAAKLTESSDHLDCAAQEELTERVTLSYAGITSNQLSRSTFNVEIHHHVCTLHIV